MAAVNQDFVTFAGDTVKPIFTVVDVNGNAVNIANVADISWSARRNATDAVAVTKQKASDKSSLRRTGQTANSP